MKVINFSNDPAKMPPLLYLEQVAEHCPKAVSTYLLIWREKDKQGKLIIDKDEIKNNYLTTLTKLKNNLVLLVKEALISIHETPNALHIEVVEWNDIDYSDIAC